MKKLIVSSLVVSAGIAHADAPRGSSYATPPSEAALPVETLVSGAGERDLRVKHLPSDTKDLKMRSKRAREKTAAQAGGDKPAADTAAQPTGVSAGYKPFPTSARDLRERVAFRIRAGVALDSAPGNGETQRGGLPLPDGFAGNRAWIAGDAIIGARGIITPALNAYFLSSFAFDATDSLATRTVTIQPYDNQALVIKAGYAEWGREDRKPDDAQPSKIWLRGGRQFRLDGGNLFAYFDGVTLGYKDKAFSASAFGGRRVALFVDTEAGILFGGTLGADLKAIKTKLALDYMGLAINSTDFDQDGQIDGELRHLISATTSTKIGRAIKLDARVRFTGLPDLAGTDPGQVPAIAFAPGRAGGRLRYETNQLVVIADVEQRFKTDIAYDLAAPASVDVVSVANKIGVLNTPVDSTAAGVRVDWQTKQKTGEVLAFARIEQPNQTPVFTDQKAYIEGGVGLAGSPIGVRGSGVYTTAQYSYRQFTDEGVDANGMRIDGTCTNLTDADMDGVPDNCKGFGDSASSGIDRMHQLAVEATLASRGGGGRHWRASAGGFFRVYDFRTPYKEVKNDARAGGRFELALWLNRDLHLDFAAEAAQASPTLAREIGLMTALRAALEARW